MTAGGPLASDICPQFPGKAFPPRNIEIGTVSQKQVGILNRRNKGNEGYLNMPEFRDRYLEKRDPCNPLASPIFGDYSGIPPLLIQVGEHEMLRDGVVLEACERDFEYPAG
jgi:acetyl esterase/lipase